MIESLYHYGLLDTKGIKYIKKNRLVGGFFIAVFVVITLT